jgi:EmrB/QacA subfamily drug resistance transporter
LPEIERAAVGLCGRSGPDAIVTEARIAQPTAALRRGPVLAACMMATFMVAVEGSIVGTAMPTIVAELGGFHLFSWVFAAYLLSQAVTVPIYGRLADLYGRKRVFFAGAALFLVSSAACGFAWGMLPLIVFRTLQGIGAGAVQPIAYTIAGDIYTPAERARVQGFLSGMFGLAAVTGPALGAFLVERGSWPAVFWINLPIGAAAITMLALFLDERVERQHRPIDFPGSLLLMIGAGALMVALVQARGLPGSVLIALVVGGLLALVALIAHERQAIEPMVPLALWGRRIIAISNLGALTIGAMMMGVTAFLPTYVQGAMGRSAGVAGAAMSMMSISWTFSSIAAGRLMVRTSYRAAALAGALLLVAGSATLIALEPSRGPLWAGAGALLMGLGMGFCNTTFVVSAQAGVTWRERGAATSSVLFMRTVGQSLGAGLFGGLLNYGLYRPGADVGDLIERLMEPGRRSALDPAEIARLTDAIAGALHGVYLIVGLLALVALVLPLWIPASLSPRQPAP